MWPRHSVFQCKYKSVNNYYYSQPEQCPSATVRSAYSRLTFQTINDTLATPQRESCVSTSTLSRNTVFVHWAWSHSAHPQEKKHSHLHVDTLRLKTDQISEDAVLQAERSLDIWKWNERKQAIRVPVHFFSNDWIISFFAC